MPGGNGVVRFVNIECGRTLSLYAQRTTDVDSNWTHGVGAIYYPTKAVHHADGDWRLVPYGADGKRMFVYDGIIGDGYWRIVNNEHNRALYARKDHGWKVGAGHPAHCVDEDGNWYFSKRLLKERLDDNIPASAV